jgi:hypothetical protein
VSSGAFAMPGQINCQHIETVVRQVAGLQNPNTVVVQHTVDKNNRGFSCVERFTAGVSVNGVAEYVDVHIYFVKYGIRSP